MQAPTWNIESEYPAIQSQQFTDDWRAASNLADQIHSGVQEINLDIKKIEPQTIAKIQELFIKAESCSILIRNLNTYLSCHLSVDATNAEAKQKNSALEVLFSKFSQAMTPLNIFICRCSDDTFKTLLNHEQLKGYEFSWTQDRKQTVHLLSESEETLMNGLAISGHTAWGNLYNDLSGKLKVNLKYPDRLEQVGLAQAHSLTRGKNELDRKTAWLGIQQAWTEHQETAAAIVNALGGWRHEVYRKRSHTKEMHFLDQPLWENRISKETLDAMITACRLNATDIQKAGKLMAKVLKKDKLDPWDLLAPSPVAGSSTNLTFEEGVNSIIESFDEISPDMAKFVKMMVDKRWIEGRVLPNKRTGAYCTEFTKSLEPRVYMTYMGSNSDISTLAHELGHAFHSWTVRDLPRAQMSYPMTLAETASIFAETILNNALFRASTSIAEKTEFAWSDAESAMSLLLNIPARFDFERKFYDLRKERSVDSQELRQLMDQTWKEWYGDTLTHNDDLYWAHKLHFHISGLSFYNFPYTFGYLFSLSIYARKVELGTDFMKTYVDILRDTGRMTAEDLIQKHLGEDIRQPEFWQKAIDLVKKKIELFELLIR